MLTEELEECKKYHASESRVADGKSIKGSSAIQLLITLVIALSKRVDDLELEIKHLRR